MQLGLDYLLARGLDPQIAASLGVEIQSPPVLANIVARLGKDIMIGAAPLSQAAEALIWFPAPKSDGTPGAWGARVLPTPPPPLDGKKFLVSEGKPAPIFVLQQSWDKAAKTDPVLFTEGPIRSILATLAGQVTIGLNGVWVPTAPQANGQGLTFRADLAVFTWYGRKVYLAFDADAGTNPLVRHAQIRLYLLLAAAGAEVFQLCTWDLVEAKGLDDLFVARGAPPADVLAELFNDAVPFVETLRKTQVDLQSVEKELLNIEISKTFRDQLCKELARMLGVHVDDLRRIGQAGSSPDDKLARFGLVDPEPWKEPVEGAALALDIKSKIRQHVVITEEGLIACTLWLFVDYLVEAVDFLPMLAITSPEKRCGKTTLLTVLLELSRKGLPASNISAASVYRAIEKYKPSLILDEVDTYLKENDNLRGIINSGHSRRMAFTIRTNPDTLDVEPFSTWGPKVLAGIGGMHETLEDRSIFIKLVRRLKTEKINRLRETLPDDWVTLRRKLLRWASDNETKVRGAKVKLPGTLNDRAGDHWYSLLQIAQVLGKSWPELAEKTAIKLETGEMDKDSFNVCVLKAVRKAFADNGKKEDDSFLATDEIRKSCNADKEAPWWGGKAAEGLTAQRLGKILSGYGVRSQRPRIETEKVRGYVLGDLKTVFARFLDSEPPPDPESPPPPSGPQTGSDPSISPETPDQTGPPARDRVSPSAGSTCSGPVSKPEPQDDKSNRPSVNTSRTEDYETVGRRAGSKGGSREQDSEFVRIDGLEPVAWQTLLPEALALDIETYPRDGAKGKNAGLDPWRGKIRLATLADSLGNTQQYDLHKGPVPSEILHIISHSPLIIHNAVFDLSWLALHLNLFPQGPVFCTQIASQLITCGTDKANDLASVVQRYLGITLSKELGPSDWGGVLLTDEQKQYALGDVVHLHSIAAQLLGSLKKAELAQVFSLEMALVSAIVRMRIAGVAFDRSRAEECFAQADDCAEALREEILSEFDLAPSFNLNSARQLLAHFHSLGCKELKSVDDDSLSELAEPLADRILEYREVAKAASTIKGYMDYESPNGRVHGDYQTQGTVTGRIICKDPALQTVPRDPRFRRCFVAPPGRALVIADYARMEVVGAAAISQDVNLRTALSDPRDFYQVIGAELFAVPMEAIDKRQRSLAKTIVLGFQYGLGAESFQHKARVEAGIELSLEEAAGFRHAYFSQFPGMASWHAQAREQASEIDEGRSLIGRQRQLYIGGAKPPTDWNKFGLCINYPVQASCADVFKLAMIKLDSVFRAKSLDATIVLTVHDELLIECDEKIAEQVRLLAQQIMESAFTTIFGEANPCDVKAKICSDWSEKID